MSDLEDLATAAQSSSAYRFARRPARRKASFPVWAIVLIVLLVTGIVISALKKIAEPDVFTRQQTVVTPVTRADGDSWHSDEDEAANVIAKFGIPDSMHGTEYEIPQPLLVSKFLTYSDVNVQFAFIAKHAGPRASHPYIWKLIGVQEADSKAAISADEAKRRLALRR